MVPGVGEGADADRLRPGLARFGADGRLEWDTPALRRALGLPADDRLAGLTLTDLLAGAAHLESRPANLIRHLEAGEAVEVPQLGGGRLGLTLARDGAGGAILTVCDAAPFKTREAILETTLEHLSQGVTVMDDAFRLVGWNRRAVEVLDFPPDLMRQGMPLEDVIRFNAARGEYGPGDPEEQTTQRMELARRRVPHTFERTRPDGRVLEVCGTPMAGGGFVTTYTDISDRKNAEVALQRLADSLDARVRERTAELEEKRMLLAGTLDVMTEAICVFDADLELQIWNQRYIDLFDLPADRVSVGTHFADIVRQNAQCGDYGEVTDVDALVARRTALALRSEPYGYRFHRADGTVLEARHRPMPDGGFLRIYADITERARVEELQAQLLGAMPFPLVVTRVKDGGLLMINRPASEMFGIAMESLNGRTVHSFYANPDDRERLLALLARDGRVDGLEIAFKDSVGETLWVLLSARRFEYQRDDALLAAFTVINERKRMEQELASQWNLLRTVLESISQGLTAFGPDLELLAWNRRFFDLLNLPPDYGSYRRPFADFMRYNAKRGEYGEGDVEAIVAEKVELARNFKPHKFERERPDGTVIEVEGRAMAGGGFVTTYTDITERRRGEEKLHAAREQAETALSDLRAAQETLIQSEKLAALGGLVAGIAHEINTPIGVTLTAASLLAERVAEIRGTFEQGRLRKPDFAAFIAVATETAGLMLVNIKRAAELIQSFKQVAVDQASEERRHFDLNTYLNEVLCSLSVQIRRAGHAVVIDCPAGLALDGYPGALSQVLTNFVMNAIIHGFEPDRPGTLTVTGRAVGAKEVELRFSDDGKGIPEANRARIFDPFFTTNRKGGGSGLGLHIVYNIVTRTLRGRISIDPAAGPGTTFVLRFPRVIPRDAPPGGRHLKAGGRAGFP